MFETGIAKLRLAPRLCPWFLLLVLGFSGAAQAQLPAKIPDATWVQIQRLPGIATQPGLSATALYIFFDPNCRYCAKLWTTPTSEGGVADVPAIWVPVAYLNKDSKGKAAALLRSSSKTDLARNFMLFNHTQQQGRVEPVVPNATELKTLQQAQDLWQTLGGATPMMVWRMRSSRTLVKYIGLPSPERLQKLLSDVAPSDVQGFSHR